MGRAVRCWLCWLAVLLAAGSAHAHAHQSVIKIGGYDFPPYVMLSESNAQVSGLVPDLLDALNAYQQRWQFKFVPTSTKRRYRDLMDGRYDIILFESREWGWHNHDLDSAPLGLSDAEVYVAQLSQAKDQSYFASFSGKNMALFNGYHYQFAGFNANPEFLRKQFNATLTYSHESNLRMLERGRVDMVVVTESFLRRFLQNNLNLANVFLISEKYDQVYRHEILARRGSELSAGKLMELLQGLNREGKLTPVLERHGLQNSLPK